MSVFLINHQPDATLSGRPLKTRWTAAATPYPPFITLRPPSCPANVIDPGSIPTETTKKRLHTNHSDEKMSDETQFLQKIQAAYADKNADSTRALNSLLFEYQPVLENFTALKGEIDRAVASAAELDVAVIVARFRPALDAASRLSVEIEMLDDALRNRDETAKFISMAQTRLGLASAAVYAQKFDELLAQLRGTTTVAATPASEPQAPSPTPALTGDALLYAQANDLYYGDNGQQQDLVQAAVLFHRLADKKHPGALARLADMYRYGEGVKEDYAKHVQYLREAADADVPEAMAELSKWFCSGGDSIGIPQSFDQAMYWATRAREAGAASSGRALGKIYADEEFSGHNPIVALGHYQQASEAGDFGASLTCGEIYRDGTGIPKDIDKAIAYFELSVRQGARQWGAKSNDLAMHRLADIYEFGKDCPSNPQKALEWYHRACPATKGSIAFSVGRAYLENHTRNEAKAVAWFTEGAAQQDAHCMRQLGDYYIAEGPSRNVDQAERWYLKAVAVRPDDLYYVQQLVFLYAMDGAKPDEQKWLEWAEKVDVIGGCDTKGVAENKASRMCRLGDYYLAEGPSRNVDQAERWYLKAVAEKPDKQVAGAYRLAKLYAMDGAKPDEQKWLEWAEKDDVIDGCDTKGVAEHKARRMCWLGDYYLDKGDVNKWQTWKEKCAALREDDYGFYQLGRHFFGYCGPQVDFERSLIYYNKGIDIFGHGGACAKELAEIYSNVAGHIDYEKAAELYRKSIALGAENHLYLGWLYRDNLNEVDQALALFKAGAEGGDPFCFNELIQTLLHEDYSRKNPTEAKHWISRWQAKANIDKFDIQYLVPIFIGFDEVRDISKAQFYCDLLLANQDNDPETKAKCCDLLGGYLLLNTTNPDTQRGLAYLERAAELPTRRFYNRSRAFELLIEAYEVGKYGVAQDANKAKTWKEARDKAEAAG